GHQHADAPHALALLRPCRERPSRRTAEQRDELAPPQLIELHSVPSQGWIAEYRIGEDQSGGNKAPAIVMAGASWQSGSNVEFGPNPSPSCNTSQSRTLLSLFAHGLGLVHLRQRFDI